MRVLLTGVAGLIGSRMAEVLLGQGCRVVGVDNFVLGTKRHLAPLMDLPDFSFKELDVSRASWWTGLGSDAFDLLIHFAANSDISLGHARPTMELERTFMTSFQALESCRALGIKHFIFSSTSAVYGANPVFPTPEDASSLHPVSNYGAAKLASENHISSFVENYGLHAWVFRFGNVVGERLTHGVIYDFTKRLRENPARLQVLGNGYQNKTYIDVDDCVSGILTAYRAGAPRSSAQSAGHSERFRVFNLSTRGSTSVRTIAERVVQSVGAAQTTIEYGDSSVGWIGDVPKTSLDTRRIEALGWKPKMTSDEAVFSAIERFARWYR